MRSTLFELKSLSISLKNLVTSPAFFALTIVGNGLVIIIAAIFFQLEQMNPSVNSFLDALWWGFSTITTVGYGDITPITNSGKVLGIMSMLAGTAIFATYTALFAQAFLGNFKSSLKRLENKELGTSSHIKHIEAKIERIEDKINQLNNN